MLEIIYKIDTPCNFSEEEREIFCGLLQQQRKVTNPTIEKVNRCILLSVCRVNNQIASIGAIKPKTNSDFNSEKSDLEELRNEFQLELGYCFTLPDKTGQGYSSTITRMLLDMVKNKNVMASTEIRSNNSMIGILERNGFTQFGKPWKSIIHKGILGLYLKFAK
jgi:RimJ/RimL family protein N-acetyltransferase